MILSQRETMVIAANLLKQYGGKTAVSKHRVELIGMYGKDQYERILAAVKHLQEAKRLRDNAPEKVEMRRQLSILKARYRPGTRYAFIIIKKRLSPCWSYVEDSYGWIHPVNLTSRFKAGEKVSCMVRGFYAKVDDNLKPVVNLRLDSPLKISDDTSIDTYKAIDIKHYVRPPEKWTAEVAGLGKHICGKAFTCSCCGRDFNAKEGYKIDFKEIYFCKSCKKEIFPATGHGWKGNIITTPMGNKK